MSNLFYTHQEMEDVFRSKPLQYKSNKSLDECVQKMKELNHFKIDVKDKKIVVVGNSGKLLKQDNAKIIDSHDIVIRCNLAITDGFEDRVGEKTDIRLIAGKSFWRDLTGQFSSYNNNFLTNLKDECFIIKAEPLYPAIQGIIKNYDTKCKIVFLRQEFVNQAEKATSCQDISVGLTAITLAVQWSTKVSIFGFSFFEEDWDEQHYFESITPYSRGHNPQLEKNYVNFLKEQNYIRIY